MRTRGIWGMIKVMIVDDEPYIRQGLRILIPWEEFGYKVWAEAANGLEALEVLKGQDIDLIITDIKMPKMGGIEFIEYVSEHNAKGIHFIILSGFYEFEYAKKAIRYGVEDYILKPVQKEELIRVLLDYKEKYYQHINEQKNKNIMNKIIFNNYLVDLLSGIQSDEGIQYIKSFLIDFTEVRYIHIEYDQSHEGFLALSNEEKFKAKNQLYNVLLDIMNEYRYHVYKEPIRNNGEYTIGFLYVKKMADNLELCEEDFFSYLSSKLNEKLKYNSVLYLGQMEKDISTIFNSYKAAKMTYSLHNISGNGNVVYYDDISNSINTEKYPVDKEGMDNLIRIIEKNDKEMIRKQIVSVYNHFKHWVGKPEIIKINLNYLMFNLINLTRELDSNINHEEIHEIISRWGNDWSTVRIDIIGLQEFALEFGDYLSRLRQNTCGGVLREIERDIIKNYMDNLSLKNLSEKYFMNAAYLGQIFKKQFGMSFKDYLNNYRIERAIELLIRTDEKIYLIAESVGFKNTDYFISKFDQIKGVTPLQFRKQFMLKGD